MRGGSTRSQTAGEHLPLTSSILQTPCAAPTLQTTVPKSLPIPAVRAIARAPKNVTRGVARRMFAPPALARSHLIDNYHVVERQIRDIRSDLPVPSENLIRWIRSRKENRIMIETDGDLLQTSARIYVGLLSFA